MNHFTDTNGYNAIRSQSHWTFLAAQPPGDHPRGAYFTNLPSSEPKLAKRLRIPREKIGYVFSFTDAGDLLPLPGGRGDYVLYSPRDYVVPPPRQTSHGPTGIE